MPHSFGKMTDLLLLFLFCIPLAASRPVSKQSAPVQPPPEHCAIAVELGKYLDMKSSTLYRKLQRDGRIGNCILHKGDRNDACPFYVRVQKQDQNAKVMGWPYSAKMQSSGCVMTSNIMARNSGCLYNHSSFRLQPNTSRKICTNDVIENAVSQIKHAISEGVCGIPVDSRSVRQVCNSFRCECPPTPFPRPTRRPMPPQHCD